MQTFTEYFKALSADEKRELAAAADTSVPYLSQIANGHRFAGASLISRLTTADPNITAAMLRSDLFAA